MLRNAEGYFISFYVMHNINLYITQKPLNILTALYITQMIFMRIENHLKKFRRFENTISKFDDNEDYETIIEDLMLASSHLINAAMHKLEKLKIDRI